MSDRERIAQALADGEAPPPPGPDSGPVERNLERLRRLAEAFRAEPDEHASGRPVLFRWRHLEVRAEIGRGGFGTVYEAFDPILKRAVALKLGQVAMGARDRWIIAEARRMARVRHPNVLAIHGADSADGRTGIWCDLVRGETLEALLGRGHRLDGADALRLAMALADALAAIHERGLVHGDVKPANVMIRGDGEPVLMDFGAATEAGAALAVAGSPIVMAPELFDGGAPSPAADVYSLGALLHRVLAGRYPVEGDSFEALAGEHGRRRAPALDAVPRLFRALLRACLAPDPWLRPSASALVSLLRRQLEAPARRRRRLAVGAVIASLALALLAATLGLWQVSLARQEAEHQRAQVQSQLEFVEGMLQAPLMIRSGPEVRVLDVLEQAARQLDAGDVPAWQEARLRYVIGRTYDSLGQHGAARPQLERAAALAPPELAWKVQVERIEVELAAEQFERAHALVDGLERIAEASGSPLQALLVRLHRGLVAFDAGDKASALRLLSEVDAAEPGLPPDHPGRAGLLVKLAALHREQAQFEQALAYAERAVAWETAHRGSSAIGTINARQVLSTLQHATGRYAEAEQTIGEALARLDRVAPGPSRTRLVLLNSLSVVLASRGQVEKAIERTHELLRVARELHGPDSRAAITATGNLGARLIDAGRYDEAARRTREALELATAKWGAESPDALLFASNLAEALLLAGQLPAALEQARSVYEANRRLLGETHLYTLFVADVLGAALVRSGEVDAGLALLDRTLAHKTGGMGAGNPFTWDTQAVRVEALLAAGRADEALALADALLAARGQMLPEGDRKLVQARELRARAQQRVDAAAAR